MRNNVSSSEKVKVTANLNAELVNAIDQFLKAKNQSRSQFIEDVLRKWHNEQKKRELESQIEEYYLSLSDEDREENQQWSKIAAHSAHQLWED
jgi:metal-responsive CopG/Arc/MetJ family transcriptional regulator